jgi:hypothetical protein
MRGAEAIRFAGIFNDFECPMSDSFSAGDPRPRSGPGRAWKQGDRVLAPWEPTFLYAGTLDRVEAGRTYVRFDDGDGGWVDLGLVRPLVLTSGMRVLSRRRMGPFFFPGQIAEVDGENVTIDFDDGKEERTTVASLRIPCPSTGRGAEPVTTASHLAFVEHLQEGDRVWALRQEQAFFPGTIRTLLAGEAQIDFDDDDESWVPFEQMMPLELAVGMFVMCRRQLREFQPAGITDTEGERVRVRFEDGKEEWTTPAALALPLAPPPGAPPAPARPRPERREDRVPDRMVRDQPVRREPVIRQPATSGNPRWRTIAGIVAVVAAMIAVAVVSFLLGRRS